MAEVKSQNFHLEYDENLFEVEMRAPFNDTIVLFLRRRGAKQ